MIRDHYAVTAALACLLALPGRTSAQQPAEQRRVDSLAAEVRALRARLDSLRAQVGRAPGGVAAPAKRDTTATDELAALRAAAAAAAGTDTGRLPGPTAQPARALGRERNQAQLNP